MPRLDPIDVLRDLISINSVNPSLVDGAPGEKEIAAYAEAFLRTCGIDVVQEEAAPGRPNVVGTIDAGRPGPSLMLCGHLDTVGVEGMAAPFTAIERDGRMYGRGTQDMKGGCAAILGAAQTLAMDRRLRSGRVVIALVSDEEHSSIGAELLVRRWRSDAAIVCEPTGLRVGIAHKGFEWTEVVTNGVAAHGSRPQEGVDAIAMMGRVLAGMEALDQRMPVHPLLGRASVHASLIVGGRELSTYPDRCTLQVERRTIPGEPPRIGLTEIESILEGLRRQEARFSATSRYMFSRPPYVTPEACPLPGLIGRPSAAVSFWTDAAILGDAGIDSVVFGPGGAGLHSVEEYVNLDEVLTCRAVLVDVAQKFCSR